MSHFPFLSSLCPLIVTTFWSLKHVHSPNTPANTVAHAAETALTPPVLSSFTPAWGAPTRARAKRECSRPSRVPLPSGPTRAVDSPVMVVDSTYCNVKVEWVSMSYGMFMSYGFLSFLMVRITLSYLEYG
jgi:hypothetical protein